VPLASVSQYPVPLGVGATATVREPVWTASASWPQLSVMSVGGEHELTKMAAMEPFEDPEEKAAPMDRMGAPFGQLANPCRMMSRWPQQPEGVDGLQAELDVEEPL
jgi:hypothetical protein